MHLVVWLTISRPHDYGGWNIKNLDWFCTFIGLRSLWLVLKGSGIWNQIIHLKYLKNQLINEWMRKQQFTVQGTSLILEWIRQSSLLD